MGVAESSRSERGEQIETAVHIRVSLALAALVLLLFGLIGAVAGLGWLGTLSLLLFLVVGPGAALVQVLGDLDPGVTIGIGALTGISLELLLGLVMVESRFWHPTAALLIVAIPSAIGCVIGLIHFWSRRSEAA